MVRRVKFDENYLQLSWKWLQDAELRSLIGAPETTKKEQLEWYKSLNNKKDYIIVGIETTKPIGVAGLKNINAKEAEYFGYIGDKENRGKGLGRKILDEIFVIATELRLSVIQLRVLEFNVHALKLYEKYGFTRTHQEHGYIFMMKKIERCSK